MSQTPCLGHSLRQLVMAHADMPLLFVFKHHLSETPMAIDFPWDDAQRGHKKEACECITSLTHDQGPGVSGVSYEYKSAASNKHLVASTLCISLAAAKLGHKASKVVANFPNCGLQGPPVVPFYPFWGEASPTKF